MILNRLKLESGSHVSPRRGSCIMEVAAIAMDHTQYGFTDLPACTTPSLAYVAQCMWDNVPIGGSEEVRQTYLRMIVQFLPRLMRAKSLPSECRVNVRLALSMCEFMDRWDDPNMTRLINGMKSYLDGSISKKDVGRLADTMRVTRDITVVAHIQEMALHTALGIADVIALASMDPAREGAVTLAQLFYGEFFGASREERWGDDCPDLLDYLLDAYEKALAEEGLAAWEPEQWEEHALAFVEELIAECKEELQQCS